MEKRCNQAQDSLQSLEEEKSAWSIERETMTKNQQQLEAEAQNLHQANKELELQSQSLRTELEEMATANTSLKVFFSSKAAYMKRAAYRMH